MSAPGEANEAVAVVQRRRRTAPRAHCVRSDLHRGGRIRSRAAAWLDVSASFEQRAASLVAQMTLDEKAAQMQNAAPAIERLVPAYDWWNEGLHGVARAGQATVFPQAIGLAATFDVPLMGQVATTISDEARAKHHQFLRQARTAVTRG